MLVLRLRPLAFATFLVWRLRTGACGVGACGFWRLSQLPERYTSSLASLRLVISTQYKFNGASSHHERKLHGTLRLPCKISSQVIRSSVIKKNSKRIKSPREGIHH